MRAIASLLWVCWLTTHCCATPVPNAPDWPNSYDQLALGIKFTCARRFDTKSVYCFGDNSKGALGHSGASTPAGPNNTLPCALPAADGGRQARSIVASGN